MNNEVFYSIVVPVYNVEMYLETCLNSILNQTYKNFELIIINDGSKDNSLNILKRYANEDNRIIIINQNNLGLSEARNVALRIVKGKYVLFVDGDDHIENTLLSDLHSSIKEESIDIFIYGYKKIDEKGDIISSVDFGNKDFSKEDAMKKILSLDISPMACNKVYKKELFKNITYPKNKLHEDIGTTYKLFYESNKIVSTNKKYYNWMMREGSITSKTTDKHIDDIFELFSEKYQFINQYLDSSNNSSVSIGFIKMINLLYVRLKSQKDKESKKFLYNLYLKIKEVEINFEDIDKNNNHFLKFKKNIQELKASTMIENGIITFNMTENYIHFYINNEYLGMFVFEKGELSDFRANIRKNKLELNKNDSIKTLQILIYTLLTHYLRDKIFIDNEGSLQKNKDLIYQNNKNVLNELKEEMLK